MPGFGTQNLFPVTYPTMTPYGNVIPQPMMQQSMAQQPSPIVEGGIKWVDGEAAARSYQIPAGCTGPIALWDTNDTVIYVKSVNQMGMPNPLVTIRYVMPQNDQQLLPGQSGQASGTMAGAVSQEEFNSLRNEIQTIKDMLSNRKNQNGMNNQSKGGTGNG